jgi:hypothetical protein
MPSLSRPRVSGRTEISSGWSELQSAGRREPQPKNLFVFANAAQFKFAERLEASVTTSRGLCKPRREQDLSIKPLTEFFDSNHFVNRGSDHGEVHAAVAGSDKTKKVASALKPGKKVAARLPRGKDCLVDLHATFDDGKSTDATGADACTNKTLNLTD